MPPLGRFGHPSAIDVAAWFDGEGDRQTGEHLESCPRCRRQLDDLGRLRSHLRSTPLPDALERPPGARPPARQGRGEGEGLALRRLLPLVIVAVFVVVLVLLVLVG